MTSKLLGATLAGALAVALACGSSDSDSGDSSSIDAPDAAIEVPEAPDAGPTDTGPAPVPLPAVSGWTFYGPQHGGPRQVNGVTADQSGNVWVAGGGEGLFLLRDGASALERFTIEDGLRPWGFPRADQGTITRTHLDVLSVAGGPPDTVFVGYAGMPPGPGEYGCEDNWDGPNPDPNIYKSGDADRVRLTDDGIEVVHYDISTGLDVVRDEPRGREKLCDVYRIVYDAATQSVWFGSNHGYAWGDPWHRGNPTCFGQLGCSGVLEHAHPLLNGYATDAPINPVALTNYYWGLAVGPSGDLWVGGLFRSQRCAAGHRGAGFWTCEAQGLDPANQIDWWPDHVGEGSMPSQRVDDAVSSISVAPDGTVWVGSFTRGLARMSPGGQISYVTSGLPDLRVTAVKVDPGDGSVWVGGNHGGITRIKDGAFIRYDHQVFGVPLVTGAVPDIQADTSRGRRRMLVAFRNGAIGIYDGD